MELQKALNLWKYKFLGFLAWLFYKGLSSTWRLILVEPESLKQALEQRQTVLFAHWHGHELALLGLTPRYRICTLVSQSVDGTMMATALNLLGAEVVRGSSSRGAVGALKGLLKRLLQGRVNGSFAVDGPKGPIHKVKPGIFMVQDFLDPKPPIFAAGVACSRAWIFSRSWNQAILPKPFAKVVIYWNMFKPNGDNLSHAQLSQCLAETLQKSSLEARKILESS